MADYTTAHIGIHHKTLEIVTVWERSDGVIVKDHRTHSCNGRPAKAEAWIVFEVGEIHSIDASTYEAMAPKIREQLQTKADEMKAAREAASEDEAEDSE